MPGSSCFGPFRWNFLLQGKRAPYIAGLRIKDAFPILDLQMARRDQLTGKGPMSGNHVSHANNKVRRRFSVNLQKKRFFIPEEGRWVTLRVSTQTLKTINKKGISEVLREARQQGVRV
jgi:large subunit ribosomal protein L28